VNFPNSDKKGYNNRFDPFMGQSQPPPPTTLEECVTIDGGILYQTVLLKIL
jgi:hypothetical protein